MPVTSKPQAPISGLGRFDGAGAAAVVGGAAGAASVGGVAFAVVLMFVEMGFSNGLYDSETYTINVLNEYPGEFTATFEATLVPGITGAGVEMCGTEGKLYIDRGRFEFTPKGRSAPPTVVKAYSDLDLDHVNNFLECVRSRKLPNGDVLIGHRSAQASHLGNISYMQKRRIDFDPVREEILPF